MASKLVIPAEVVAVVHTYIANGKTLNKPYVVKDTGEKHEAAKGVMPKTLAFGGETLTEYLERKYPALCPKAYRREYMGSDRKTDTRVKKVAEITAGQALLEIMAEQGLIDSRVGRMGFTIYLPGEGGSRSVTAAPWTWGQVEEQAAKVVTAKASAKKPKA